MGAETSKFMGFIFIQIIVKTCHWSASENENENKENVVLTLKEQANKKKRRKGISVIFNYEFKVTAPSPKGRECLLGVLSQPLTTFETKYILTLLHR